MKTREFFVSLYGSDTNTGTKGNPFATLHRAQSAVRDIDKSQFSGIIIYVREGTYYLDKTLSLTCEDSGTESCPVIYMVYKNEEVILSGGKKLNCDWKTSNIKNRYDIMECSLPEGTGDGFEFDQLFAGGRRQILARFPNAEEGYTLPDQAIPEGMVSGFGDDEDISFPGKPPRGILYKPGSFSEREWARPEEAVIHIFQAMYWGNLQFRIKRLDRISRAVWFGEGGTQMGAKWYADPCCVDGNSKFYIENVFEELDSPGEWYFDRSNRKLFFIPPEGMDIRSVEFVAPALKTIVDVRGTADKPVKNVTFAGFRFMHTGRTLFNVYDIPSLGDWAIHRGGTVFLENTCDCSIRGCFFDAVGGNAVFVNGRNRGAEISGNRFSETGDSAVCLVGIQNMTVGSQRMFPFECRVENNTIHDCGIFGKQTAGVFISVARRITAGHNHIYNMPRAGICINDGTWGGHVIEYNRIHDTCRETGDHGPFNAWGRDRYWCLLHSHGPSGEDSVCHQAGDVLVDQTETTVIRYNFLKEKSGWGLDLDDGASNYHIYNNLCVGVSMKLREGAYRLIENNIWVNGANSPCFHVGNVNNHDRYVRNITVMSTKYANPEHDLDFRMGRHFGEMYTLIKPPNRGPWLEEIDYNLFYNDIGSFSARVILGEGGHGGRKLYSLDEWRELGYDIHSEYSDPMFADPESDDYRVLEGSPALKLGFVNFDMDNVGVEPGFVDRWEN